jgi:5'-phosphate synthase pdxT subunit
MSKIKVGVVAFQGAVTEHIAIITRALGKLGLRGDVVQVRTPREIEYIDSLVIPGGESTTIARCLDLSGCTDKIIERVTAESMPVLGTCAGCILVASEGDEEVLKTGQRLIGVADFAVTRNAFGRQRESFEQVLRIEGFEQEYPGVFIRAPAITRIWGDCKILAKVEDKIVMVRDRNVLAVAFHPELTDDTRIHEYFLGF